jgi:FkbM family methyltransferase
MNATQGRFVTDDYEVSYEISVNPLIRAAKPKTAEETAGPPPQPTYFSACGEDYVLNKIFYDDFFGKKPAKGFYVDIGAHHPTYASNTAFFYNKGWNGINIEANPGALRAFERDRPRDININAAVSSSGGGVDFYLFGDSRGENFDSSSTTDPVFAEQIASEQGKQYTVINVPGNRLETLLDKHSPGQIDFMSIDIEGQEIHALMSNNWEKYRPAITLIEILPRQGSAVTDILNESEVAGFLCGQGYRYFTQTLFTFFFYDTRSENARSILGKWGFFNGT